MNDFDEPYDHSLPGYVKGSATSKAAAESFLPRRPGLQALVLDYITNCGEAGATDDQTTHALGFGNHATASVRRLELVVAGLVVFSGKRRRTKQKCLANVWIASSLRPPGWTPPKTGRQLAQERRAEDQRDLRNLRVIVGQHRREIERLKALLSARCPSCGYEKGTA